MSAQTLTVAESLQDENQQALAASDLAGFDTSLGRYVEALPLRERAEATYRRLGDETSLAYTLANHADLLIRLGRHTDAEPLLSELETGISKGLEAYAGRARRVTFLRAFDAATQLRCDEALQLLAGVSLPSGAADSTSVLAPGVTAFCEAKRARPSGPLTPVSSDVDRVIMAERTYWLAMAAVERADLHGAAAAATDGLSALGTLTNDELRWRLRAAAAIAAPDVRQAASHRAEALAALGRIRAAFAAAMNRYETRPDLLYLRKRAGLT
jgi:tetratricopeptide (TPR) repeat protein